MPAVGLIKKVDFFIKGVPFDLKVTYLPEGYIKDCRKAAGEKEEIRVLKKFCHAHQVHFDKTLPPARLLEDLWNKVTDLPVGDAWHQGNSVELGSENRQGSEANRAAHPGEKHDNIEVGQQWIAANGIHRCQAEYDSE